MGHAYQIHAAHAAAGIQHGTNLAPNGGASAGEVSAQQPHYAAGHMHAYGDPSAFYQSAKYAHGFQSRKNDQFASHRRLGRMRPSLLDRIFHQHWPHFTK